MYRCTAVSALKWISFVLCATALINIVKIPRRYDVSKLLKTASPRSAISPECACFDSTNQMHDFCYQMPTNKSIRGRKFNCSMTSYLEELGLLDTESYIDLTKEKFPDYVFVSAFSSNHVHEGRRQLRMIRSLWPKQKVIIYDLGIGNGSSFFENACNVEVRRFNFSKYPAFVSNLSEFRWKPIIIAETLKEFGSIFYMDSSITFKKANLSHVLELVKCRASTSVRPKVLSSEKRDIREMTTAHESGWNISVWKENIAECRKSAYLFHGYTGHGIYPATHPGVFDYIPTDFNEIRKPKAKMYEAGFVYVVRTQDAVENVLKWYVMCALEEGCMAPKGAGTGCVFTSDRFKDYASCHRFDQSVVNLLSANAYYFDRHYYTSEIVDFFNVVRNSMEVVTPEQVKCDK